MAQRNRQHVHDKEGVGKHVLAHHHPRTVPDDLEDQTAGHADEKAPCPVADAKGELHEQTDAKDGQEMDREQGGREGIEAEVVGVLD